MQSNIWQYFPKKLLEWPGKWLLGWYGYALPVVIGKAKQRRLMVTKMKDLLQSATKAYRGLLNILYVDFMRTVWWFSIAKACNT